MQLRANNNLPYINTKKRFRHTEPVFCCYLHPDNRQQPASVGMFYFMMIAVVKWKGKRIGPLLPAALDY